MTEPAQDNFELRDDFGNTEANLHFLHKVAVRPGMRMLEIGSGRGALLQQLLQQGHSIEGVEINADRIAESRARYGPLPITKVDGPSLPFPDGTFDVVVSFDVFEHIPDSDEHLREVRRVLSSSGRYLFQTPNRWTNTVFETIRWRSFTVWRQDHCSLHGFAALRRRLKRHGFDPEFVDVPVVTDFFRRKIRHYLGAPGMRLVEVINPDKLPLRWRTNFYVIATKR